MSHDPEFKDKDNVVRHSIFWVSDLSLVLRVHNKSGHLQGFVLNADTGEPIQGAKVRSWVSKKTNIELEPLNTDANGIFNIKRPRDRISVLVSHGGKHSHRRKLDFTLLKITITTSDMNTRFFTDRSLYRPGQTIRYKGISYRVDQGKDNYKVIPDRELTVVFRDSNNQEIARAKHRTNDYGSFEGSFTAPRDRLMGRMRIHVEGSNSPKGSTHLVWRSISGPSFK